MRLPNRNKGIKGTAAPKGTPPGRGIPVKDPKPGTRVVGSKPRESK